MGPLRAPYATLSVAPAIRRVPMRQCVVCRESFPKRALIRLYRLAGGELGIDLKGTGPGRGAYVCRRAECWALPALEGRLRHALPGALSTVDRALLARTSAELNDMAGRRGQPAIEVETNMD